MRNSALQERRNRQILADLVRAYIETGEPVSSRAISKRYEETLSTATIRNVMADLEDGGYLYQPHTSAGRVPTSAAYRFFAQEIASQATISVDDREWIQREMGGAKTASEITERAGHVLAEVSNGLGIVVSPPLGRTVLEHARMWLLPDNRVVIVLISPGGHTRQNNSTASAVCAGGTGCHGGIFEPALFRLDARSDSRGPASETRDRAGAVRRRGAQRADALRSGDTIRRPGQPGPRGRHRAIRRRHGLCQSGATAGVALGNRRKASPGDRSERLHRDARTGARANRRERNLGSRR